MSYRGRYQIGEYVPLTVWCIDGNGTPTLPDQAPIARVYSDAALVLDVRMPIRDRYILTGYFQYPLFLDGRFAAGGHRVVYEYQLSSTLYMADLDTFEVTAGGHADGAILSMFWFNRPTADFLLTQVDSGRLVRRRNPRLA